MAEQQNQNGSWQSSWNVFGFELGIRKKQDKPKQENISFVPPTTDDGSVVIQSGSYFGTYVDIDGSVRNEIELITKYRDMSLQPECESAIDDIVNEAIITEDNKKSVSIVMDDLKGQEKIKKKIAEEFDTVLRLLNYNNLGHDIFRRWYVDGRLFYHVIIDEDSTSNGIKEVRLIDPRRIRKIKEIKKGRDPKTGLEIVTNTDEYYVYNERGIIGAGSPALGAKISKDSIVYVTSGLMDAKRIMVLSYLHKAIKPLNQLRMLEDATVIYRLARAPERRAFYVDVGNMSTIKAEQYLKSVMTNYRNKLVYDAATGEIKDDRKMMTMLEDFWLPRREGNKSSEIQNLPGGQNLGEIADVEYFEKKLYKALGVPYTRTQPGTGFSIGRSTEITRDEIKFAKFINRLRNKFATLFDDMLRVQLQLKGICSEDEWNEIKEDIYYDFVKDNNWDELKEAELNTNRFALLTSAVPYQGTYLSKEWIQKHILRFTDDEIEQIKKEIKEESKEMSPVDPATGEPLAPEDGGVTPSPSTFQSQSQPGMRQDNTGEQNQEKQKTYDPNEESEKINNKRKDRFNIPFEES